MKIALVGGHLSPALSVIDALEGKSEIIFIGRKFATEGEDKESFEYKTITGKGIPFFNLVTGRLQRSFSKHTIRSLGKIPGGFSMSYGILKEQKPDVLLAFGGYLSVPICFAAKILSIPVVIHEQTLHAGLANKITARVAAKICLSWESSINDFPKRKSILTGNPLRKEIVDIMNVQKEKKEEQILYITGGSTGSHVINETVKQILPQLLEQFTVYHQAGNVKGYTGYEELSLIKASLPIALQKRYFLSDHYSSLESAQLLHTADLVISRAGINTITELLFLKKPAILIPLLYGQHNEQAANALFFKEAGLGKIIQQQEVTSQLLLSQIREMFASINTYTLKQFEHENERNMHAAGKLIEVISHVSSNSISQKTHSPS